jgi:hypothetical protein
VRPADRRRTRLWLPVIVLGVALLAFAGFLGIAWWAYTDARAFAADARVRFGGDDVGALTALLRSEQAPLEDRNHAVRALGQVGDARAVPVLERYYTGQPCDHQRFLCQRELEKAIKRCNGENWAPAWLPFFPRRPAMPVP